MDKITAYQNILYIANMFDIWFSSLVTKSACLDSPKRWGLGIKAVNF